MAMEDGARRDSGAVKRRGVFPGLGYLAQDFGLI